MFLHAFDKANEETVCDRKGVIIIIINVYRLFFPCKHGSDVSPKIFLFHNCLSWASPTLKPKSFMSLVTHCNYVFLPLPLSTFPSTSTFVHFLTQSSSAFLSTCPNHLNLPHLTISVTASILRRYVEELYEDKTRTEADMGDLINEVYTISENEIREVISELSKGKACGEDNIPIELLQCMEEEGIETVTSLIDQVWDTLKECIEEIAEEICGKEQHKKKQNWMTAEILHIMEERRMYKNLHTVEGDKKYKEIKHSIQKFCSEAKDKYFNDKCKEIEMLDKCHNQLLYKKVKALQPRESRVPQVIKDKTGKSLMQKEEILERWAEYVEELY